MTNPQATPDPHAAARAVRTLALAVVSAPALILVALLLVLPTSFDDAPSTPVALGLVGLVLLGVLAAEVLGFRAAPLSATEHADHDAARSAAFGRYQALMFVRVALTELPVLAGVALSFALEAGAWPALVTIVLGVPAMAFEVWPSRRNVGRVAARLEAGGVRSGLDDAFSG